MESDLTGKHGSFRSLGSLPEEFYDAAIGELQKECIAIEKAQRLDRLVTLTGHALAGYAGNPTCEGWTIAHTAKTAVDTAEAALSLIEERTK